MEHSVNASHFLLESWMYIHVECSSNIRMSEYRTDSFIVATALYAKLQAYMAAGKPVVAMIDGEARTLIAESHCGLSGPVEDSKTLTDNILKMKNMTPEELAVMGQSGLEYFQHNFRKDICMNHLCRILEGE